MAVFEFKNTLMNTIIYSDISELPNIAEQFLKATTEHKHFAFYGEMGVGKTTLIKELCKQLGVTDMVTSPTFSIINEYSSETNGNVYHFDFYRTKNIDEVYNLGYEDYLYSDNYCFIEWPELIEELLPEHILKVNISLEENNNRKICF